jgi:hypothetical protein
MRNLTAIAAALAINVALALAFQHSANEALPLPEGEVTVTPLSIESVTTLAHAAGGAESSRAAM